MAMGRPSRAGGAAGRAAAGLAGAVLLSACGTFLAPEPLVPPEIIQQSSSTEAGRPQFFVQWKAGLPGLTQRPSIDASSQLPRYPPAAARKGDAGITTVETCVTVEGRLVDVRIVQSSGSLLLDEATLAWTKVAKYRPAEFNGQPFAVCGFRFDYEWRVNG